jgi:hypothetical protein
MTAAQKPGSPDLQPPGAELTILPRRAGRKEALPLLVHMIGAADRHQAPYPLTCKLDIRQRAAGLGEIAGERSTFAIQPRGIELPFSNDHLLEQPRLPSPELVSREESWSSQ